MSVRALQCPRCGAPVAAAGSTHVTCNFCGAALLVGRDASGKPAALLSEVKQDTGFMAKRMALSHLETRLKELKQEREDARLSIHRYVAERLDQKGIRLDNRPLWPYMGLVAVGVLIVIMTVAGHDWDAEGGLGAGVMVGLVMVVVGGLLWHKWGKFRQWRRFIEVEWPHEAESRLPHPISEMDRDIGALQRRYMDLKGELDQMVKDL